MFSMFLREFYVRIKNIYLLSYFDKSTVCFTDLDHGRKILS